MLDESNRCRSDKGETSYSFNRPSGRQGRDHQLLLHEIHADAGAGWVVKRRDVNHKCRYEDPELPALDRRCVFQGIPAAAPTAPRVRETLASRGR